MANKYEGTQTEKNLWAAFAGESQARNKYTYFASKAKKEGFEQIAALFLKTADNEKEHAKIWFKELDGIGTTAENLLEAAERDNLEFCAGFRGAGFDRSFCGLCFGNRANSLSRLFSGFLRFCVLRFAFRLDRF